MTLNELRYIVAVAQERNFRRAAERCFVSQPALSLAIQKLEEELGVQLFERSRSEIKLTLVGGRVIEQAARVLDEAAKIRDLAKEGADQLAGPLRLGVIHTIGPYLLPGLIAALREIAPNMPLEVEEGTTANLEKQLRNSVLDVVIIALPFSLPGVETTNLYDESFVVVVPSHHAWANKEKVIATDLATEKVLLLNSTHCFSNQVVEACPELSRTGEVLQGNSLETIRNMVASGLGIAVLPSSATIAHYRNPLLKVIPFAEPQPTRRVALAYRKSFSRPNVVDALVKATHAIQSECFQLVVD
ncbi:MAG: LysR family transcriptional regulator [Sulfuritalea sp.]|jgi:LysR family hydrogen peroxide-inducible transcriptional activator|nr:LysR family transcriptional regulator [Sulfuritalea sp.]